MVYSQKKRRDLAIYRGSSNELITHITSILGVRLKGYINCKKSLEMQCGVFPERERREFPIEKKKFKKIFLNCTIVWEFPLKLKQKHLLNK